MRVRVRAGRIALLGALLLVLAAGQGRTADRVRQNPYARDPDAVQAGRELYLERCAVCHGQDATGSMAANLVRSRAVAGGAAAALFDLIVKGIPGTEMPPQPDFEPEQVWRIVSYLHSLARPGLQPPVPGDAAAGRRIFVSAGCVDCHRVGGEGGFWGPPLDSIAARKTSDEIRIEIEDPNTVIAKGYSVVVVTTQDGERIEGMLKNEDTFSMQLLARDGAYHLLSRSQIREIAAPPGSVMPGRYAEGLTEEQMQNLLAFLDRQRAPFVVIGRGFQDY